MSFLSPIGILAAQVELPDFATGSPKVGPHLGDMAAVIAATCVVMSLMVVWAVFIRKPKNEHARTRVYKSHEDIEETDDGMIRKRKKHRRRRREHRQRNPTLAEAGGLPPERKEDEPAAGIDGNSATGEQPAERKIRIPPPP